MELRESERENKEKKKEENIYTIEQTVIFLFLFLVERKIGQRDMKIESSIGSSTAIELLII